MKKLFKNIYQWFKQKDRIIYLEYSALSLLVILPLLRPGYILLLDLVFTPKIPMPTQINNSFPLNAFLHYLNLFLPSQIIEKLLLFLILALAGIGIHKLIDKIGVKNEWAKYFAGILFIFNPFVYSRFMTGQIFIILAYALIPFFVRSILNFFDQPDLRTSLRVSFWTLLISIISIHSIFFMAMIAIIFGVGKLITKIRDKKWIVNFIKFGLVSIVITLALSFYWFMPYVSGKTKASQIADNFDIRHVIVFQTSADKNLGVLYNTAGMYGFWAEEGGRYLLAKDILPYWPVLFGVILLIVFWGIFVGYKKHRYLTISFTVVGFFAFVFAVGSAYPGFEKIYWLMLNHVPLFNGYREPQKFVTLLILSYAVLGALGVEDLLNRGGESRRMPEGFKMILPALFIIIPVLYSPVMLWGFGGQIKPVDYPKDWYQINQILNNDKEEFKVLFLPWHEYIGFRFADRTIANPAPNFFEKPTTAGDNPEFGTVYSQTNNPTSDTIREHIVSGKSPEEIAGVLTSLDFKYILLAKEADWEKYNFFDKTNKLLLVEDAENIKLYRNLEYKK